MFFFFLVPLQLRAIASLSGEKFKNPSKFHFRWKSLCAGAAAVFGLRGFEDSGGRTEKLSVFFQVIDFPK